MSNRVIKDIIWDCPTLAKLPDYYEDQFPRWLLLPDDWGCFNANPDRLKGMLYPNRKKETSGKIIEMKKIFSDAGLIFFWEDNGRDWGFIVSFESHHNYSNKGSVEDGNKRVRHTRKTPEPPREKLEVYLQSLNIVGHSLTQVDAPLTQVDAPLTQRDTKSASPSPSLILNNTPNLNNNPDDPNSLQHFEQLWKEYPCKQGKHNAWLKFQNQVGTGKDLTDIQQALFNYKASVTAIRNNGHPDRQYQHGSTWFNQNWKDYIEYSEPEEESTADGIRRIIREKDARKKEAQEMEGLR